MCYTQQKTYTVRDTAYVSEAAIHSPGSPSANTRQAPLVGGWSLGHEQEAKQNKHISIDISEANSNAVLWQVPDA